METTELTSRRSSTTLGKYPCPLIYLRDNGVSYISLRDTALAVKYFDIDGDGSLNYNE
jgi:hypothetical protein